MQSHWFQNILKIRPSRWYVRRFALVFFYLPLFIYTLLGRRDELLDSPVAFDVGIVTVSAAFGGLILNAGLRLTGPKREETIEVAQKFIVVVVLMIIFLPSIYFVGLMGDIDINAFKPGSLEAWIRAFFFAVAAISFYVGIGLFIVAIVDLVFAIQGIGDTKNSCRRRRRLRARM